MCIFVGLAWSDPKCYIIRWAHMSFCVIGPGWARSCHKLEHAVNLVELSGLAVLQ